MKKSAERKNEGYVNVLLRKHFGKLRVVDGKGNLILVPNGDDLKSAIRLDPANCVLARAAHRVLGSTRILIFQKVVYVDHPNEEGEICVHRYVIHARTFRALEKFDKTGVFNIGVAFHFSAPSRSERIEWFRKQYKKWRRSDAGKAIRAEHCARNVLSRLTQGKEQLETRLNKMPDISVPKAQDIRQQLTVIRRELVEARKDYDIKRTKAAELRTMPVKPANRKTSHQHDLVIRNGRGFFTRTAPTADNHVNQM